MLSDNIRMYRKSMNMSQDELAEKLEVTRQSISLWETGQTQPSLDNIVSLAKIFNISTDELLKGNNSETSATVQQNVSPEENKKKYILPVCIVFIMVAVVTLILWLSGNSDSAEKDVSDSNKDVTGNKSQITEELSENQDDAEKTGDESTATEDVSTDVAESDEAEQEITNSESTVASKNDLYGYLKNFVITGGTLNGDYCFISKPADSYGGYAADDFSLYYWGDTDTVEFCLHRVIDETLSINFYLFVPKSGNQDYTYLSSCYYRDSGEALYEAKGTIHAPSFTRNYPLTCTNYIGSADVQNDFMEISRQGICETLDCLKNFVVVEGLDYSFSDMGFVNY